MIENDVRTSYGYYSRLLAEMVLINKALVEVIFCAQASLPALFIPLNTKVTVLR